MLLCIARDPGTFGSLYADYVSKFQVWEEKRREIFDDQENKQ